MRLRVLFVLSALGTALALPGAPSAQTPTTLTFNYTGAAQTWTVPAGVSSATFDAFGAQNGGRATATIAV